jgi:hypothetical protein
VTFVMGKYEEFKGGSKDMDADALAKAISTWEDQKIDEVKTKPQSPNPKSKPLTPDKREGNRHWFILSGLPG